MQSLKYFLDDLCEEPDSDENVPLVPIASECIMAVSKSDMKGFLKSLGLHPPGAQVGNFFRIFLSIYLILIFISTNAMPSNIFRKHFGEFLDLGAKQMLNQGLKC